MSDSDAPRNLVDAVLHYNPNVPLAIIAGSLFAICSVVTFAHVIRYKHWWGTYLPFGAIFYAIGFFMRVPVRNNPDSLGLFIIMQLFQVCSPAFFLAFNYIVYGRLLQECVGEKYSLLRPAIIARTFVISDVVTFLVQGGGGGLQAQEGNAKLGANILLVGLILQTLSYVVFSVLIGYSHWKIKKLGEYTGDEIWWKVIWILYFSSIFIMIRGAYRVVELAQGDGGYLLTHEVYLYALDTLPLLLAVVVYVPYWPGVYIYVKSKLPDHMPLQQRRASPNY